MVTPVTRRRGDREAKRTKHPPRDTNTPSNGVKIPACNGNRLWHHVGDAGFVCMSQSPEKISKITSIRLNHPQMKSTLITIAITAFASLMGLAQEAPKPKPTALVNVRAAWQRSIRQVTAPL